MKKGQYIASYTIWYMIRVYIRNPINHYQRLEAAVSRETSFHRKMDNKQKIKPNWL